MATPATGALRRGLAAALACGLACPAVVLHPPAAASPPAPTARAAPVAEELLAPAQAVLDRRVAALGSGDRPSWLATVDPQARPAFREAQGRIFDGLRSLPVTGFSLEARLDDTGDLSGGLADRYGAPVFLPETRQSMRLAGYDDRDAVDSLWLTFVQRGGAWFVAADDDLSPLGLDTARGLWEFGPVETMAGEHVLTIHHPAQRARAAALADLAETAVGLLASRWDLPWSGRIPLVVPGSTQELEELIQSTADLDKFVAFVSYGAVRDRGWEATAPRIYVQDENLSGYGRDFQLETMVHELVHAAGAGLAGPFVPAWVHEGLADWVATGRRAGERKPKGGDRFLPADHEFTTGSRAGILRAYRESRSVVSYLSARRGAAAPAAVFEALSRPKVAPGNRAFHTDAALRAAAGTGLGTLEAGWAGR